MEPHADGIRANESFVKTTDRAKIILQKQKSTKKKSKRSVLNKNPRKKSQKGPF